MKIHQAGRYTSSNETHVVFRIHIKPWYVRDEDSLERLGDLDVIRRSHRRAVTAEL